MKPEERQRRILALLERESGLSAGQLAHHFQVSRMTIHRDLRQLFHQGSLIRIYGGVVAKSMPQGFELGRCSVCSRPALPHQRCELHHPDGAVEVACCAACGLGQFMLQGSLSQLWVGDQISGRRLRGVEAVYLVNSLASPCCQPSLLSFADEVEAALFQAGFGGVVAHLEEALEFLRIAEGLNGK
jgi:DNA-binding Lrp family transcriptional regulator